MGCGVTFERNTAENRPLRDLPDYTAENRPLRDLPDYRLLPKVPQVAAEQTRTIAGGQEDSHGEEAPLCEPDGSLGGQPSGSN